jgi:hypothetical protein
MENNKELGSNGSIPLCSQLEILASLNPNGMAGVFVLLKGYIDESVSKELRIFTLSALVAQGDEWVPLAEEWQAMLADVNVRLVGSGKKPLRRYHAAECNARSNDFEGWSESEQRELTTALLAIINRHPLKTVSFSVDLCALADVIAGKDLIGSAYAVTTLFLVYGLGQWIDEKNINKNEDLRLTLVHERCDWDEEMLTRFKSLKEDPSFFGGRYLTTIAPLGWEECIPLQLADLMAYENMKDAERRLDSRDPRYTFQKIHENESTGIRNRTIGRDMLRSLGEDFMRELRLPDVSDKKKRRVLGAKRFRQLQEGIEGM